MPLAERRALVAAAANDDPYAGKNAKPPREVWRLLERLISDGPGVPKLWTGARDVTAMLEVLDALDSGAESLPGSTCAAAHALLHILAALRDPLVPLLQQQACTAAKERYAAFGAVEKIPSIHANVLIGLMSVAKLCAGAEPVDDASGELWAVPGSSRSQSRYLPPRCLPARRPDVRGSSVRSLRAEREYNTYTPKRSTITTKTNTHADKSPVTALNCPALATGHWLHPVRKLLHAVHNAVNLSPLHDHVVGPSDIKAHKRREEGLEVVISAAEWPAGYDRPRGDRGSDCCQRLRG